jgi:hypothetical protein
MKKQKEFDPGQYKPDLKHDSMEFAASTDGEDPMDFDDPRYEEEGITAEELEIIDEESPDKLAEALYTVETDRVKDTDNLPDEDWTKDLPRIENLHDDHHRKDKSQ